MFKYTEITYAHHASLHIHNSTIFLDISGNEKRKAKIKRERKRENRTEERYDSILISRCRTKPLNCLFIVSCNPLESAPNKGRKPR